MKSSFLFLLKTTLTVLIIFADFNLVYSQNTKTVKGIVFDSSTQEPIEFANISLAGTMNGTTTDNNGKFEIAIKNGIGTELIVSHINYFKEKFFLTDSSFNQGITILMLPKAQQLNDVVVSATLSEKALQKISKSAAVITQRNIVDNFQSNMTDMLAVTPGFSQVWEYHSPLLLRGMNSNRLIVMKNGNRRIGTFPGGYFGQDINIYDTKRIEVIKGPGSVIYGSGAISGIVNIISPEPFGTNETNLKLISGYGSNNTEFLEALGLCLKKEDYGININCKYRKTDEYLYGNGKTAENSQVEDRDISLNAGYKFSEKHQITLHADYHYGDWGKPRGFNGPEKYFTEIRNEEESFHAAMNYTFSPNKVISSIKLNLFYDDGSRDYYQYKYSTVTWKKTSLELVHYKDNYGGGQLYAIINPVNNYIITTGIDGYIFTIDGPTENFDYYNNTSGRIEGYKNAGQNSLGAFINNEWQLSEKFIFDLGIRFDNARVYEGEIEGKNERKEHRSAVSGNAGLVFSADPNTHFSFNIGRAFRMPITEELFTKTVSCKGIKEGNPDLNPEYSWNFDTGLRGNTSDNKLNYELALFYNYLNDYINEAPDNKNEDIDFTYKNVDARIAGGEISGSYRFDNVFTPSDNLFAEIGASYQYGVDLSKEEEDSPLFGIPPFTILARIKYKGQLNKFWITGYFLKIESEYVAAQNRIAEIPEGTDGGPWGYEPSEAHVVFNLSLGLNFNSLPGFPKLRFMAKNLFDSDYKPFGSYIPAMGRNIKVLLSFNF